MAKNKMRALILSFWIPISILEYKDYAFKRRKNTADLVAGKISYQGGTVIILNCQIFFLVADFTEMLLR